MRESLFCVNEADAGLEPHGRDRTRPTRQRHRAYRAPRCVPPGRKVEPGETPREAARLELLEETGLEAEMLARPAAVCVRSYHPDSRRH
ncbi:NUDIX domain-containing protein [Micromonospora chalcea]|uniref:NUDIX domain-containing protein n=1 Tax=Micromonospora chalcea TaxID=1874 RepID=UPI003F49F00B